MGVCGMRQAGSSRPILQHQGCCCRIGKFNAGDFRISITDAPGRDAYPMASYTWLLTPAHIPDPVKKRIIVDFLRWMVLHGQRMAEEVGYARLPDAVAAKVLKACDRIQ